jgi:hypothetical protein
VSDFIAIDITGEEEIAAKLRKLPGAAIDMGVDEASEYLKNSLRQYPPYAKVTRAAAYPEVGGWFSDKQRRWFFANLRNGNLNVPYGRTQQLANAWKIIGKGKSSIIANEMPYAKYVMGDSRSEQSRMSKLIGWLGIDQVVKERLPRIIEKFDAGVKKAIRKLGL